MAKNINKILILFILCITACLMLGGCALVSNLNPPEVDTTVYPITFMVDGKIDSSSYVNSSGAVTKPLKDPVLANHRFVGWSTDKQDYVPYDFNSKVTGSLTLYAYFVFDEEAMASEIDVISNSIVKVTHTYKENGEGMIREGIGIVYHVQGGYCYVVTNYHTVILLENQSEPVITVTDREGNEFASKVFKGEYKKLPALDKEYDLAVVCFPYTGTVIKELKNRSAVVNELGQGVISVGTTKDYVASGKVSDFKKTTVNMDESLSSIDFEVYCHNAVPSDTIKESLLFDLKAKFLGITYYSENGEAYTIPQGRIAMFLNEYLYG